MISKRGSSVRIGLPYLSRPHSERSFHNLIPRHPRIQESSITFSFYRKKSGSSYAEKSSCIKLKTFPRILLVSFASFPDLFRNIHPYSQRIQRRHLAVPDIFLRVILLFHTICPTAFFHMHMEIYHRICRFFNFVFFSTAAQTGSNFSNSIQNHPLLILLLCFPLFMSLAFTFYLYTLLFNFFFPHFRYFIPVIVIL